MKLLSLAGLLLLIQTGMAQQSPEARALVRSGNAAYSQSRWIEAEIAYRKALDLSPDLLEASFNLGNALLRQGRHAQAISAYQRALAVAGEPATAARIWYNQGHAHLAVKDFEAAAEAFRQTLRKQPADEEARRNLAICYQQIRAAKQPPEPKKEDNSDQQNQQQQEEQQAQEEETEEQSDEDAPSSGQPPSRPMTPEEAEQMLRRLESQEQQVQQQIRQRQGGNRVRSGKDW
jgi:Ca-activated chloride channel homolog